MEALVHHASETVLHDVLVLALAPDGTITFADGADGVLDCRVDASPGRAFADVAKSRPEFVDAVRRALSGRASRFHLRGRRGGAYEVRVSPRRDPTSGRFGATVVATYDDAPYPRASEHLRRVFEHLPGAVWATDKSLRITDGVGHLRDDAPLAHAIGASVETFVGVAEGSDDDDAAIANHRAALAGESRAFRYEFDGRWYEVGIEPRRDGDGRIIGTVGVALDVTERQSAERSLVESERRLSEASRIAHLGSWEWDVRRDVITWSDELFRIYGIERDAFDGKLNSFLAKVHPDDVPATRAVIDRVLHERKTFDYRHRIIRSDGAVRMLATRTAVRVGAGDSIERVVGTCWDITDRWNADRALEESTSLLRTTLESTADGLLVVDNVGRVRASNRRFAALWRIDPRVLATGDDRALLDAVASQLEDPDGFSRRVNDLYRQPEAESFDTVRFSDGRTYERYSIPHRLGDRIVGRVWSFRDVSERERLLRHAIFLADASRLLASLDAEPALEAVAQLAVPSLAESCAIDLMLDDGTPRRMIAISSDRHSPPLGDIPAEVRDGRATLYTHEGRSQISVPLLARGQLLGAITLAARAQRRFGEGNVELFEELARRIELALENARLYRQAQDALRAREDFLSIAAHEIRGPITSMHLAAQLLQKGHLNDAARERSLDIIAREDVRLARFVDELLDVTRIRTGQLTFHYSKVDLTEVVRTVAQRLSPDLLKAGSTLSITAPERVEGMWDRSRVDQVVTNLLSNAIKFGLARPIEIAVTSDGGVARLVVSDQGIGIAADRQARVFRAFERAVSARHYGGLGLGLFIVHTIVEGMNGTVTLESELDRGTRVVVELPVERLSAP